MHIRARARGVRVRMYAHTPHTHLQSYTRTLGGREGRGEIGRGRKSKEGYQNSGKLDEQPRSGAAEFFPVAIEYNAFVAHVWNTRVRREGGKRGASVRKG